MFRLAQIVLLAATLVALTATFSIPEARAAGLYLEGTAVEAIPPTIIPPSIAVGVSGVESVGATLDADRGAFIDAFFIAPPDDGRPESDGDVVPPDDGEPFSVAHTLGFEMGLTPVSRIVAACGEGRTRTNTRIYPLEGRVQTLPADCVSGMKLGVFFNDGSTLVVGLDVRGESESGFVGPLTAVGFNPQPEPPGRPLHLEMSWEFGEAVSVAHIELSNAVLHPPEPGAPAIEISLQ